MLICICGLLRVTTEVTTTEVSASPFTRDCRQRLHECVRLLWKLNKLTAMLSRQAVSVRA